MTHHLHPTGTMEITKGAPLAFKRITNIATITITENIREKLVLIGYMNYIS